MKNWNIYGRRQDGTWFHETRVDNVEDRRTELESLRFQGHKAKAIAEPGDLATIAATTARLDQGEPK